MQLPNDNMLTNVRVATSLRFVPRDLAAQVSEYFKSSMTSRDRTHPPRPTLLEKVHEGDITQASTPALQGISNDIRTILQIGLVRALYLLGSNRISASLTRIWAHPDHAKYWRHALFNNRTLLAPRKLIPYAAVGAVALIQPPICQEAITVLDRRHDTLYHNHRHLKLQSIWVHMRLFPSGSGHARVRSVRRYDSL